MKFLIIALAIGTMALSSALAEEAKVTKPQQFADLATVANMFEVQSSELAVKQATGPITNSRSISLRIFLWRVKTLNPLQKQIKLRFRRSLITIIKQNWLPLL
jgi:hypothetical protein